MFPFLTRFFFAPSCPLPLPPLHVIEVSVSRRRRCITRCPKTPPSYPSYLPSSSNGNRRGAEGWRDPGEGGEGGWNMAERRRGSWHHGERKRATITGKGWISESPVWPARCRAGSGGGAAAVADTARPRIRHSLTHHTCSGNSLRMATCCGIHVVCTSVHQQCLLCLWKHTHDSGRGRCVVSVSPTVSPLYLQTGSNIWVQMFALILLGNV